MTTGIKAETAAHSLSAGEEVKRKLLHRYYEVGGIEQKQFHISCEYDFVSEIVQDYFPKIHEKLFFVDSAKMS